VISHLSAVTVGVAVITVAVLAVVVRAVYRLLVVRVAHLVCDVRFGDRALQIVLLHLLPIRRIAYTDIATAAATTRRQLIFRHASGKMSVTGLINRPTPLVAIHRSDRPCVFAYTPANRYLFLRELDARIARARGTATARSTGRSRMRKSGGGVAA